MKLSRIFLNIIFAFQVCITPHAYAEGLSFDFEDEPVYVGPGNSNEQGRDDGNCIGGGCDSQNGGNQYDDDNEGSNQTDDHEGSASDGNRNSYDRGERNDDYRRGYGSDGRRHDYVFNPMHSKVSAKGLWQCSQSFTCAEKGYGVQFWKFQGNPDWSNTQWNQFNRGVKFAKYYFKVNKHHQERIAMPSQLRPEVRQELFKQSQLLIQEAKSLAQQNKKDEGFKLLKASDHLTSFIIDFSISVSPLGWAKDVYEFMTGRSIVTGQTLSNTERVLAGAGVILPGVVPLAFAGLKIVARNPLTKEGVKGAIRSAREVSELLGELKMVRFKEGKNVAEVAIIGRNMDAVRAAGERLSVAGISTRIFEPTEKAMEAFRQTAKEFGSRVPYENVPATALYRQNMEWIERILKEDITVIDVGNSKGVIEKSRFYDDEVLRLFGEAN